MSRHKKIDCTHHRITVNDYENDEVHTFCTEPEETIGDLKQKMKKVLDLDNIFFNDPFDKDDIVISTDLILTMSTMSASEKKEKKEKKEDKESRRIGLLNTNDRFMISNASPSHSFWEMIVNDISLIVIIDYNDDTDDNDNENLYSDKIYKNITVSTSSVSRESSFSEIGVKVVMTGEEKEKDITILHYNGWKKNGIPDMEHFQSFLTSYSEIRNRHKNHEMIYSADLVRPGIFLACVDLLTSKPQNEDGSPGENNRNLFDIVQRLSIQVPLHLNDLQAKFVSDVMLTRMREIDVTEKFDKMSLAIIYFQRNFYQQCKMRWEGKWYNNSIKFPYLFYPIVLISTVKNTFDHVKICRDRKEETDTKCFIEDIVDDEEYASLVFYNADGCAMYKKGGEMGHKSAYGVVYHTCCGEEEPCHHITKIVKFRADHDIQQQQANFHKEVMLQQKVAKAGLAPPIVTSYITPTQGIVVMEKMNKTLLDHMNEYFIYAQLHNLSFPEIERTAQIFAINMGELLIRLHQQGIYHQDAHLNNVMTNRDNRLIFIDFGMAIFDEYDNEVNHPHLNVDAKIKFDREYRQIPNIRLYYIVDKDPDTQAYVFMNAYIKHLEIIKKREERALIRGEKLKYADKIREDFADIIKSMNVIPISTLQTEMLPLAEPVPVYFNL